ncbi:MAG: hypothetical protein LIP77_09750 [Planctomycetes bacterium]|nr:hypothetical protein [Planctomycetota bacterium]
MWILSYDFSQDDGTVYNCGFNESGQLGRVLSSGDESSVNLGLLHFDY